MQIANLRNNFKVILFIALTAILIYSGYNFVLAQLTKPYPEQEFSLTQHLSANEWELSFDALTTAGSRLPGYENRSWVPTVIWAIDLTIINNGEDSSYVRNDMFHVSPTAGTPDRIYDEPNKAIISERVQPGAAINHQLVFLVKRNCRSVQVYFRPDGPGGEEFSTTVALPKE
ncbi:MAG: hypothetical protein FH749_15705 [Firmicutes bacterium]|nr:hypothetical protein [Bacillota bacterium]